MVADYKHCFHAQLCDIKQTTVTLTVLLKPAFLLKPSRGLSSANTLLASSRVKRGSFRSNGPM